MCNSFLKPLFKYSYYDDALFIFSINKFEHYSTTVTYQIYDLNNTSVVNYFPTRIVNYININFNDLIIKYKEYLIKDLEEVQLKEISLIGYEKSFL